MLGINKRETGLGFTVLTLFVALYLTYLSSDRHAQQVLEEERMQARLAARSLEAGAAIQDLHRSVENFLLSRSNADAPNLEERRIHQRLIFNDLDKADESAAMTSIRGLFEKYVNSDQRIISLRRTLGLKHDAGIEGQLRHAVHSAENILTAASQDALLVDLLMLRRHEKDFMMRREQRYIDKFNARYEQFQSKLISSDLSSRDRQAVIGFMEDYVEGFQQWTTRYYQLTQEMDQSELYYNQLTGLVSKLTSRQIAAAEDKSRRRAYVQHRNDLLLFLMVIVMIASGGMLIMLVTRYRRFSDEVEALANKDSLTNLPNRRGFFKLFEAELKKCRVKAGTVVVGVIDLDGFKAVNDIFGHAAGDQLLIETGSRLRDVLGEDVIIGRMGGDEYGLVLPGEYSDHDIMAIGNRICAALAAPFDVKEGVARVSGSIGFAVSNADSMSSATLYERADYALYHSKNNSRGKPILFSQEHESEIRDASTIEQKLLEADEDEFHVMFQPIVDVEKGKVVGLEALARWRSPSLGDVRPDVFIAAAEQSGVVTRLTAILLKKALEAAKSWPDDIYLSFNLSALDLASPESAMRLLRIIVDSGFPTNRLFMEITETAIMQDFERSMTGLNLLAKTGVKFALDDFGTGYSSLGYLQRLPIDRLKIDRSFTEGLESKKATRDIIRSVIGLCKNLEIDCVVEGIEERRQVDILSDMGAGYIQGYYFSEPMDHDDTLAFLGADESSGMNEWVAVA